MSEKLRLISQGIILSIGTLLAACAALITATPAPTVAPTPGWLHIQFDPSLAELRNPAGMCTPPGLGLTFEQTGNQSAPPADLVLHWGMPTVAPTPAATPSAANKTTTAFEIGMDELVLVVNPHNPIEKLQRSALQLVYTSQLNDWDNLGQAKQPLTAYAYTQGNDAQAILATLLDAGQSFGPGVVFAPGPAEMRSSIAADPGALGFLPRRWLDSSVRVVPIPDLPPGRFTRPLLAVGSTEPQGALRAWLLCLQDKLK